jgi:hypothetical protein
VINDQAIFGRDVGSLKGKTMCQQVKGTLAAVANNIPRKIMVHYRNITLCIDIMLANKIPFFMWISRNIRFITAEVLDSRKEATLVKALKRIYGIYRKRGFRIQLVIGDSEFECTCGAHYRHPV